MRPTRRASTKGSVRRWASAAYASRFLRIGLTSTRRGDVSKHTPSGKPRVLKLSGISTTYPRPTSSLAHRSGAPLERGPSPLQSCMITTAGNGPGPAGFESVAGIWSAPPVGDVVAMESAVPLAQPPGKPAPSAIAPSAWPSERGPAPTIRDILCPTSRLAEQSRAGSRLERRDVDTVPVATEWPRRSGGAARYPTARSRSMIGPEESQPYENRRRASRAGHRRRGGRRDLRDPRRRRPAAQDPHAATDDRLRPRRAGAGRDPARVPPSRRGALRRRRARDDRGGRVA